MSLFNSNNYSCSAGVQACVSRCVCVCVGGVGVCFSVCVRALSQIRVSASVEAYRARVHRFVQLVLGVLRIADGLHRQQKAPKHT